MSEKRWIDGIKKALALCQNGLHSIAHTLESIWRAIKKVFRFQWVIRFFQLSFQCIAKLFHTPYALIRDKISAILEAATKNIQEALSLCWGEIRKLRIGSKTIGERTDFYLDQCLKNEWVKNLIEASRYDTQKPTLVATGFANILALVFPLALMQVYDRVIPNRTLFTLVFLSIGVIAVFLIESFLRIARAYINLWADTKYEFTLGKKAFNKIMNSPMYITEKSDVGTRLIQFSILDQLKGFYNTQLLTAIYEIPFLFLFLLAILYLGSWLFVIPLLVAALTTYFTWHFTEQHKELLREKITFEAKESDFVINVLTGIHTVKSIGMEELLIRRHERLQETGTKINYENSVHDNDLVTIKSIASQSVIALTATFGSILVIQGHLAIGGLAACILLASRVMQPFDRILSAFNRLSMINLIRQKLDDVFTLPSEENASQTENIFSKGEIELNHVSFGLAQDNQKIILDDIVARIPSNSIVGIMSHNNTEKTALLNILALMAKPTSGDYCVDGNNINQYRTALTHKKIAYLNRVGKLFRGSLMDNLSAFDEKLIPIARRLVDRLGLNAILSKLPNGYDTYVGEKAVEALPGGVLNMIFIIRALVNKPKIIIYDEANINLDTQYTQNMLDLLQYLKEQATVIVFLNKKTTEKTMDHVFELKNKKLERIEYAA